MEQEQFKVEKTPDQPDLVIPPAHHRPQQQTVQIPGTDISMQLDGYALKAYNLDTLNQQPAQAQEAQQ